MKSFFKILFLVMVSYGCGNLNSRNLTKKIANADGNLRLIQNINAGTISVFKNKDKEPILTQNANEKERPYIHPIIAPDGKGVLTEFQPAHHKHQTGLYWGLKMVNGLDFFMNWQEGYYRRVSANIVEEKGFEVKWQTVYDLLDENGKIILTETQNWSMMENKGEYILDLVWKGKAKTDITFGKFYVGGLFLRMPWKEGIPGEVINASGKRNQEAEQQRAIWADIGIEVEGREDLAHVAILDHPENNSFPIPWRVDGELGIGPSRQILGDWSLKKEETEVIRYRMIVYTGKLNNDEMTSKWKTFVCEF